MAKKKDTLYSPNGKIEKSILSALKEITKSDAESYFILFKYVTSPLHILIILLT